MWST
jgi:hypothetical protein